MARDQGSGVITRQEVLLCGVVAPAFCFVVTVGAVGCPRSQLCPRCKPIDSGTSMSMIHAAEAYSTANLGAVARAVLHAESTSPGSSESALLHRYHPGLAKS